MLIRGTRIAQRVLRCHWDAVLAVAAQLKRCRAVGRRMLAALLADYRVVRRQVAE